jgi:hypothetical protein
MARGRIALDAFTSIRPQADLAPAMRSAILTLSIATGYNEI